MDQKILKKYIEVEKLDLTGKIELICMNEEIHPFWVDKSKAIEDDYRKLIALSDPWIGKGVYKGDLLMFVDGYMKYVYSSYSSLAVNDFSSVVDMKFNVHSSMVSQIFNGMNHISHLLIKDEGKNEASIQTNIKNFILKSKNAENEVYCDILEYYVNSYNFLCTQEIRNHLTHKFSFPLHLYGIHLVVINIAYIAFQFMYYLKLVLDGDYWLDNKDKLKSKEVAKQALQAERKHENYVETEMKKIIQK